MSFLHAIPGKEAEFNAAVDEWEAFAATKRGTADWEKFPFMSGVAKVPVPKSTPSISETTTSPIASIPTSGPAVFAPRLDATREEVGASVKECFNSYEKGGVAAKRYAEIMEDESAYMRMLRVRFDLAIARAFGGKHIAISLKARQDKWAKEGLSADEKNICLIEFHKEMAEWEVLHAKKLCELETNYKSLQLQMAEEGIDDGVDIDQLTRSIANGKLEKT